MANEPEYTKDLTILGKKTRNPMEQLETFPTPKNTKTVEFWTDELTSLCPMTGQPDFGQLTILYEPNELCIESKSLKLYLWTFREVGHFCEALASDIAQKLFDTLDPKWVKVTNKQSKRGGIETTSVGYCEQ
tara:strand:+ start:5074 stop:5469 length:396 start_codon:yes stop_codon:yes gene_type:complete